MFGLKPTVPSLWKFNVSKRLDQSILDQARMGSALLNHRKYRGLAFDSTRTSSANKQTSGEYTNLCLHEISLAYCLNLALKIRPYATSIHAGIVYNMSNEAY